MTLHNDKARCAGYFVQVAFGVQLHPICNTCARYTTKTLTEEVWWTQGIVVDGVCEHKIKDTE